MGCSEVFFSHYSNGCPGVLTLYKWHICDTKTLERPKRRPVPSLTATSVATESECAHSDTNIGWVHYFLSLLPLPPSPPPRKCNAGLGWRKVILVELGYFLHFFFFLVLEDGQGFHVKGEGEEGINYTPPPSSKLGHKLCISPTHPTTTH